MKLMSNAEVEKLKLNNDKVEEKKRTGIQKRKLTVTLFAEYVSSENIYILILCCQ